MLCTGENAGLLPPADQKANCSVSSFTSTSFHRPAARVVTDCGYSRCLQSISQDLHQRVVVTVLGTLWAIWLWSRKGEQDASRAWGTGCCRKEKSNIVPPVKCGNTEDCVKFNIYRLRAYRVSESAFSVWAALENKTKMSYLHTILTKQ